MQLRWFSSSTRSKGGKSSERRVAYTKALRASPHLPAKAQASLKSLQALQRWTSSSKQTKAGPKDTEAVDKDSSPSANATFRALVPDKSVVEYIERLQLGRRRLGKQPRRSAQGDKAPITHPSPADAFFLKSKLKFLGAATSENEFINNPMPEVAFVGRSNVGKSSLLNAVGNSTIARTSDKPGKTQSINWYSVGSKLSLIDLPGYGFAYAEDEKASGWRKLMARLFDSHRASLKRCLLLVDSRHPLKQSDREMIKFFDDAGVSYQLVLTKSDTVLPLDLAKRATMLRKELAENFRRANLDILIVSARNAQAPPGKLPKGSGISQLRSHLLGIVEKDAPASEKRPEATTKASKPVEAKKRSNSLKVVKVEQIKPAKTVAATSARRAAGLSAPRRGPGGNSKRKA